MKYDIKEVIEFARKHYDAETFAHALRVADRVEGDDKAVAILHDIIEDTDATYCDIKWEFDSDLKDEVEYITRVKTETYRDYIKRIAICSDASIRVKIADLEDHLHGAETLPPGDLGVRYAKALAYLKDAIAFRATWT